MKKITFLGVWMTADYGETVSFLIEIDNMKILVDSGMNIIKNLTNIGINPHDIDHLIVTHLHGDHVSSFPYFIFYRFTYLPAVLNQPSKNLNLYSTKENISGLFSVTSTLYRTALKKAIITEKVIQNDFDKFQLNENYSIQFVEVDHGISTVGFRIESVQDNFSIAYSADTKPCDNVVKIANGANLLIHDVIGTSEYEKLASKGHSTAGQVGKIAKQAGVKTLIPVHRLSMYRDNDDKIINEIKNDFDGNILMPNDLDSYDLEKM